MASMSATFSDKNLPQISSNQLKKINMQSSKSKLDGAIKKLEVVVSDDDEKLES